MIAFPYPCARYDFIRFDSNEADTTGLVVFDDGESFLLWCGRGIRRAGYIIGPARDAIIACVLIGKEGRQHALSIALDYAGMEDAPVVDRSTYWGTNEPYLFRA